MILTQPGQAEVVKGAFHGSMLTLAAIFTVYNAAAFVKRGQAHLLLNTLVYGSLGAFEISQVLRHAKEM